MYETVFGRRISPQEEVDLEALNAVLHTGDTSARDYWATLDPGWRSHIFRLFREMYLGESTVETATYL